MNYFEELKGKLVLLEGMEEEKINEIIEFSKKSIPLEFIPKSKYTEKVEELEGVNTKLADTNKQIEELTSSTADVDEYKKKLDTLTQEYETYKGEADVRVANIQKVSLLKDKLISEGADKDNIDLLLKDFNIDDMQLENDKIIGLDEYIEPIKERRARLFVKEQVESNLPDDGGDGTSVTSGENDIRQAMGLSPK